MACAGGECCDVLMGAHIAGVMALLWVAGRLCLD